MPTDDRAYLQSLLNATSAGDVCQLPSGPRYVGQAGSAYYGLTVPAGVTVRGAGAGTTLLQMPGTAASVRLFQMDGAGAVLDGLTLDGNAANQTADEHRAGAFVTAAECVIRNVTAQNFTGDGLYLYTGANSALVDACTAIGNVRNGITLAGGSGITVRGGEYSGNLAQQVDSEPGSPNHVDNVTIADVLIDTNGLDAYALTVSGSGSAYRSSGWRITGCTILGSVHVVWANDVLIASNTIANGTDKPGVDIYRTCANVTIARNTIASTRTGVANLAGVQIMGTGTGQAPSNVLVADNAITMAGTTVFGVRAQGCLSFAAVGNTITGSGATATGAVGVYLRATNTAVPFALAQLVANTITGFGNRGVSIAGNGAAQLTKFRGVGNTIGDASSVQSVGMSLDDGNHPVQASDIIGNAYGAGVTSGAL